MLTASFARPVGLFDIFNKLTAYLTAGDFVIVNLFFVHGATNESILELVGEDLTTKKN